MDVLVRYQWPGNIREPQNVIERGVIVSRGPVLKVPIGEFKAHTARAAIAKPVKPASTLRDTLGETERNQILKALEQSQSVIAGPRGAAARWGTKRSTLQFGCGSWASESRVLGRSHNRRSRGSECGAVLTLMPPGFGVTPSPARRHRRYK